MGKAFLSSPSAMSFGWENRCQLFDYANDATNVRESMTRTADWILSALLRMVVAVTPRRLLGSLSWHVGQFVCRWQDAAPDLRKNTWFERFLLSAAAHPWRFLAAA